MWKSCWACPLRDPERPEDITPEQARLLGFLEQALRAEYLYHRNKDYIVQSGEVVIVDEFTGRLMPGRRWSDGLHQSVEAKEGVKVQAENVTYATITIQNYFRMYEKIGRHDRYCFNRVRGVLPDLWVGSVTHSRLIWNIAPWAATPDLVRAERTGMIMAINTPIILTPKRGRTRRPSSNARTILTSSIAQAKPSCGRSSMKSSISMSWAGRSWLVPSSVDNSEVLSDRLSANNVRRLAEVYLIRNAYLTHNNLQDREVLFHPRA